MFTAIGLSPECGFGFTSNCTADPFSRHAIRSIGRVFQQKKTSPPFSARMKPYFGAGCLPTILATIPHCLAGNAVAVGFGAAVDFGGADVETGCSMSLSCAKANRDCWRGTIGCWRRDRFHELVLCKSKPRLLAWNNRLLAF